MTAATTAPKKPEPQQPVRVIVVVPPLAILALTLQAQS